MFIAPSIIEGFIDFACLFLILFLIISLQKDGLMYIISAPWLQILLFSLAWIYTINALSCSLMLLLTIRFILLYHLLNICNIVFCGQHLSIDKFISKFLVFLFFCTLLGLGGRWYFSYIISKWIFFLCTRY